MAEIDKTVRWTLAEENLHELAENPYPGRGLVQGLNRTGDTALQAYWVMGRSENSRNRVLVEDDDVVRTEAWDDSRVTDPSLIIYNAMRCLSDAHDVHIASNGNQTDTIFDGLVSGRSFATALEGREYEPDAPNYTPRISGIVVPYLQPTAGQLAERGFSVIRRDEQSGRPIHGYFRNVLEKSDRGFGQCVHTYTGDGDPLPSFDGEPFEVPMGFGVDDTAEKFWGALNTDNRVALVVKGVHLATRSTEYRIINAHEAS
ncbi:MAG TPA: IMP cyclohydrolase [Candidatus Saccharimonadales bacterium]|nr:IMP cyclohydrolase [Candidatus Saccharimonadales bacterium]